MTPNCPKSHENEHGCHLIDVAFPLPVYSLYTYRVPQALEDIVAVGKRVLAPFGSRLVGGYVMCFCESPPDLREIKCIEDVLDVQPLFPADMIPFFQWIADYYIHPIGSVIQTALPAGLSVAESAVFHLTQRGRQVLNDSELDPVARVALTLLEQHPNRFGQLQAKAGKTLRRAMVNRWVASGWIQKRRQMTGDRIRSKTERFVMPQPRTVESPRLSRPRKKILALLEQRGGMSLAELKTQVPTAPALVRAMARAEQVAVVPRHVYRDPFGEPIEADTAPELTSEQELAFQTIHQSLNKGFQTFLLAGVTGSGKTEVYLRLAESAMKSGRSVLVLVPEIALISQMERAFRARFGEVVALLHSGLSRGERLDQWYRISKGEARIAIGARSAIFAPFSRPGLLIVDEEHDDSYKQEGALHYHARDMAVVRGRQCDAVVVLGSATPAVQSTFNVEANKFKPVYLSRRVDQRLLPHIQIEDLGELKEERGLNRFLSPVLIQAIAETLDRNEQSLLFLNRRGFAGTLICGTCGQILRCDRCDISLTFHQQTNAYKCHYCGFSQPAVARCSRCGSSRIKRLGLGTEKLEAEIQKRFSGARVARMDRDTTRRKGAVVKILKALRNRQIDILVGTQMVAKGHDYPNITLVGIVCADLSLSLPDFRAGERTFQLLAQVAGRAGRGRSPGKVILQTYNPEHFSIAAARHQDYQAFYRQEIEFRRALQYPPFTRMIQILISGKDKNRTSEQARLLGKRCRELLRDRKTYRAVEALGPIEAPLARIAGRYRWQLLLKGPLAGPLHRLGRILLFEFQDAPAGKDIRTTVDVDPVFLM